jgi:SAM-dependent methyltransferase
VVGHVPDVAADADMSPPFHCRTACALCGQGGLAKVMSLADTPPANEFISEKDLGKAQDAIPLTLVLCESCGHLQLSEIVDPTRLFGHYVYVSGTSPVFVQHFSRYAATAIARFELKPASLVLEVGSNDGTLLRQFQAQGISNVLGIDPAAEIAKAARDAGVPTIEAFFTPELAEQLRASKGAADLITANNVFAHSADLASFARGIKTLLADQGVFVFEVSYLVDVIQKLLFDTIYHEHSSYHAVTPLVRFFENLGLRLFDAERIDTHGGSIRCYVSHGQATHSKTERLDSLLRLEGELGLFSPATYLAFKQRISDRGRELRERLEQIRSRQQSVVGFGAPAKLTTLMHEFGIDRKSIDFIVDDSTWKQGCYTPGMHIPVVSAAQFYERPSDWCVIFAWNFADSIIAKHARYQASGGRFLVPLPELREI